jgi:hypothetical protein
MSDVFRSRLGKIQRPSSLSNHCPCLDGSNCRCYVSRILVLGQCWDKTVWCSHIFTQRTSHQSLSLPLCFPVRVGRSTSHLTTLCAAPTKASCREGGARDVHKVLRKHVLFTVKSRERLTCALTSHFAWSATVSPQTKLVHGALTAAKLSFTYPTVIGLPPDVDQESITRNFSIDEATLD